MAFSFFVSFSLPLCLSCFFPSFFLGCEGETPAPRCALIPCPLPSSSSPSSSAAALLSPSRKRPPQGARSTESVGVKRVLGGVQLHQKFCGVIQREVRGKLSRCSPASLLLVRGMRRREVTLPPAHWARPHQRVSLSLSLSPASVSLLLLRGLKGAQAPSARVSVSVSLSRSSICLTCLCLLFFCRMLRVSFLVSLFTLLFLLSFRPFGNLAPQKKRKTINEKHETCPERKQ